MQVILKIILFVVYVLRLAPDVYANEINFFKEKIRLEKQNFSKTDLNNVEHVKKNIHQMYLIDQEVRQYFIANQDNPEAQKLMISMDGFHLAKMKDILQANGWITISKFGRDADHWAWLLIQHADQDPFFQAGCLFLLGNLVAEGETDKKNYAYLYDRVALKFQNLGMKQKYGTQVSISGNKTQLLPYEGSLAELNKRRRAVGLNTVDEYLKMVSTVYKHPASINVKQ